MTKKTFQGGLTAVEVNKPVVLKNGQGQIVGVYKNFESASRKARKLSKKTVDKV